MANRCFFQIFFLYSQTIVNKYGLFDRENGLISPIEPQSKGYYIIYIIRNQ